jgi:ADP-heptose:LPS heptosyltransferase
LTGREAVPQAVTLLKSVERFARRRYLAFSDRPFSGTFVTSPRDALALRPTAKILLLRQDRIGDVLVSVPVVRALRRAYPEAELDMLFSRTNYAAREAVQAYLRHAWRYDKTPVSALRLIGALRREHYDVVVDLMDNPSTNARLAALWSGAPRRVGIRHERAGHYTHAVPLLNRERVHIVDRIAQLLLVFGLDPARVPLDLEYPLSNMDRAQAQTRLGTSDRPLRLIANISGSGRPRYWGVENFVACLGWLQERDARFAIAVGGAQADAADVRAIATRVGGTALPALSSFHEYAALIREADLLLTPDTSILHLGAAWKIPTVALFHQPAGAPLPWFPYRSPYRAVLGPSGVDAISVPAVEEALASLIAEQFGQA